MLNSGSFTPLKEGEHVTVTKIPITGRQSNWQHVEHYGAQNNVNKACCVLEGVATQQVRLGPSLTNKTQGHRGH